MSEAENSSASMKQASGEFRSKKSNKQPQRRGPPKRDVHGWLILDKPIGVTSTHAVAIAKRVFAAKKAGHAGTLDPLASGLLPIAFGEATKTVPYVMDGEKAYLFTVKWGAATDTDDAEGKIIATSEKRPTRAAIEALLPRFIGEVLQIPPQFSALKIDGERAYDLARGGEVVDIAARQVVISRFEIVTHSSEETSFIAECGKGTYVRALARDLGQFLSCYGHIIALRRTSVGPFLESHSTKLDEIAETNLTPEQADEYLVPVETALNELQEVPVQQADAARLLNGQSIMQRGRDAILHSGSAFVTLHGKLIAIVDIERGEMQPKRIFHL